MRSLSTAAAAALSGAVVPVAILVEMDLTEPLFLNTSSLDLVIAGVTYYGAKGLGKIGAIQETSAELPKITFELAGVQPTMISLALQEPVQGKAVRIKLAIFDPATGALLDVRMRYAGWLDVMSIADGRETATINVSSECAALDLLRPSGIFYNDSDQQALTPGDLAFQYVNDQVEQRIVWPAASFFKK
jgi:hypothetical protein